jgi:methionine salvage enolase-phosphatase E1
MYPKMDELDHKLPNIVFEAKIQAKPFEMVDTTLQNLIEDLKTEPESMMIFSDRCEHFNAVNELGMVTCRIRTPNKPCKESAWHAPSQGNQKWGK